MASPSGAGINCLKILLTVFNFIFWCSGVAILAIGVWTKLQLHIYLELTNNYFDEAPLVLIGVGCGIIVIGTLGCLCTVKGKSYLLYLFAAILVLVFICELTVAICAFVFKGKLETGFDEGLTEAINTYKTDKSKREAMDGVQKGLKCCGKNGFTDWFAVDWSGQGASNSVPTSCCVDPESCQHENLPSQAGNGTSSIHTQGCFTLTTSFLQSNFSIIGGVGIGFAFLQLFGAMLACCLGRNINKSTYEQVA